MLEVVFEGFWSQILTFFLKLSRKHVKCSKMLILAPRAGETLIFKDQGHRKLKKSAEKSELGPPRNSSQFKVTFLNDFG